MSNERKINNAEPFGLMFFEKFKTNESDSSFQTSVAPKSSGATVTGGATATARNDIDAGADVDVEFADIPCLDKPRLGF